MRLKLLVLILCCVYSSSISAQVDTLKLTLNETIELAQQDAPDIQIAKTSLNNNYWRYQSFLANYKPQINLFANPFPALTRAIESITQPDGTESFLNRSLMRNGVTVALQQDIALTGGRISASTGLQRLDIFESDGIKGSISYLSSPISITLEQPIWAFNQLKWDKRIRPVEYEEAKRAYSEDFEEVAFQAATLFFEVLNSQLNVEAALRDKADADTLYNISQGRFEVGRIAETELLQIELGAMQADANMAQSRLNLQTNTERLRDFLGINQAVAFNLVPPYDLPGFSIDADKALSNARNNRSAFFAFQRRLLEAEQNLDQAKKNNGFNADLFLSFGLTQTADNLGDAFREPLDQEQVNLGLTIPIADWGKAQSRLEIAKSNQELVQRRVEQEQISFEREIIIKVQQFDLIRNQTSLALRSYEVARKSLGMTRSRYRIGKISVTDLNQAISAEATSRRSYINALRNFWLAYFDLRRLTLYDFENDESLIQIIQYDE